MSKKINFKNFGFRLFIIFQKITVYLIDRFYLYIKNLRKSKIWLKNFFLPEFLKIRFFSIFNDFWQFENSVKKIQKTWIEKKNSLKYSSNFALIFWNSIRKFSYSP